MTTKQLLSIGAMVVLTGSLSGGVTLAGQKQASSADTKPSEFGRVGNKGEGFPEQDTIKGKGRNPESSTSQASQVTIGGARPVVDGQIVGIQGDDYVVRDSSGSEVHLRVNKDTNMDCAAPSGQAASMSTGRHADDQGEIPPTSHMQETMGTQQAAQGDQGTAPGNTHTDSQKEARHGKPQQPTRQSEKTAPSAMRGDRIGDQSGTQTQSTMGKDSGGDIARGSGFTIGPKTGCQFKAGDHVKAEVSDLGTVLYLKQMSDRSPRQEQRASGQMLPDDTSLMPGHKAAAQQQAQMMTPGSVPAPADHQNPDVVLEDGKTGKAEAQDHKDACEGCTRVRGKVVRNDHSSLVIKDKSQKEISLRIDETTRVGQTDPKNATFIEGDRVEAYVKDGHAWSVTQLKQQSNQPGVDAEGD
jgi:hypothetical protein